MMHPIAFLAGVDASAKSLRGQIYGTVKAAISAEIECQELTRTQGRPVRGVAFSLFPELLSDALMPFELADRGLLKQTSPQGELLASRHGHVLVPGRWMRDRILQDDKFHLPPSKVLITGSPRIDFLRQLQADREVPASNNDDTPRVLYVPLHENWRDENGLPLSSAAPMAAYLDQLKDICRLEVREDAPTTGAKQPVTEALLDADIVITDYTSTIYEAWALGKPVIFPRWLLGNRGVAKAPKSAEAFIYDNKIGHHAGSLEDLLNLISRGQELGLGDGVEAFMEDYLDNFHGGNAAQRIAQVLERLADPAWRAEEVLLRNKANDLFEAKNYAEAASYYSQITERNDFDPDVFDRLAHCLRARRNFAHEIDALNQTLRLETSPARLTRLGDAKQAMGRSRAAVASYQEAIRLASDLATYNLYFKLGIALATPGHDGPPDPEAAEQAYAEAIARDTKHHSATLGVGAFHASIGRWDDARDAFSASLESDPINAELHYRLGRANERCYQWSDAEANYRTALALNADTAPAHWLKQLAFTLERQEKFDEAAKAYAYAASQSHDLRTECSYRAGYCLERLGRYEEACDAHMQALQPALSPSSSTEVSFTAGFLAASKEYHEKLLEKSPQDADLWDSYARLLERLGDLGAAAHALDQFMLHSQNYTAELSARHDRLMAPQRVRSRLESQFQRDASKASQWLEYSSACETLGDLEAASDAMWQVLMRMDDHIPDHYNRYGMLLYRQGRFQEACDAFRNGRLLQRPHGIYEDKFKTDKGLRFHATYREYLDCLPLQETHILYEVHGGASISCSPLAIFEDLLEDPAFSDHIHIWTIRDIADVPERFLNRRNVFFVTRGSDLYLRALATAKYLVNNGTFAEYFTRREGQRYLNTWHGTPLKTLGAAMKLPPFSRTNTARNYLQATHMVFPNEHTMRSQIDDHRISRLCSAERLMIGYPRNDQLVECTQDFRDTVVRELELDPELPVVLFAPTYRGSWNAPDIEFQKLFGQLVELKGEGYQIVFRGHHLVEKHIKNLSIPVFVAPSSIDTNRLLAGADVLISDYSSIIVDFLVTGRAILQFVPDWDQYDEERGLYFTKDELPFPKFNDIASLKSAIRASLEDPEAFTGPAYQKFRESMCAFETGTAVEAVKQRFFLAADSVKDPSRDKDLILIRSALGTVNGVASSAIALVRNISTSDKDAVLLLDATEIKKDELGFETVGELEEHADVIFRNYRQSLSLEEQWVTEKFNSTNKFYSDAMQEVFLNGVRHECRRVLGHERFSLSLEHQGYHPFWVGFMACVNADRHAIYQHNDMEEEARKRVPNLRRSFQLYELYDRLLSVSKTSMQINEKNFTAAFPDLAGRFRYVSNGLDAQRIRALGAEIPTAPDYAEMVADPRIKIVNVARMWPEKCQTRLVRAIEILVQKGHDVALYILGTGPLRGDIAREIRACGLQGRAYMLGVKRNPFPYMRLSQCHALSSDYEGQGIVLLEAMVLGIPCVSTDIPGPHSVLEGDLGVLTELTPEALAEGIATVITGRLQSRTFDAEVYNTQALSEFFDAVNLSNFNAAECRVAS